MRVLQISADRSKRGILAPGSAAYKRQQAYAAQLGNLDIIGFSLKADGFETHEEGSLRTVPTNSKFKLFFGLDTIHLASAFSRPTVVSVQDPFETGLIGWCIAWMFRAPLHVQVHTDFLSPAYAQHSMINRLRTFIAGFVLRRAKRIRVVSDRIRFSLLLTYKTLPEISVLPIFVDLKQEGEISGKLKGRFARFSKNVLVVARLEPEKNVMLALQSFIAASPSDTCLIIVGAGSQRSSLEEVARISPAHDRIFFEGETDAAAYYSVADLVLVTSLYEGYGLVIVEALARGIPVISTDVGIAREAGAIIAHADEFDSVLNDWFRSGSSEAHLSGYPYSNFEEYVGAYAADIMACAGTK